MARIRRQNKQPIPNHNTTLGRQKILPSKPHKKTQFVAKKKNTNKHSLNSTALAFRQRKSIPLSSATCYAGRKKMKNHPTSIPSIIWCEKCDKRAGIIIHKKNILCLKCYGEKNEKTKKETQKNKLRSKHQKPPTNRIPIKK